MTHRLVAQNAVAKIYSHTECGDKEYIVKPIDDLHNEAKWYFTDDKDDAFGTADFMLHRAADPRLQ